MPQIWITGAGIVCPIGLDKQQTLASLLAERSGIAPVKYLSTTHREFPVGEVKMSNEEMASALGIDPSTPIIRSSLMGVMALREALADARLSATDLRRTGFISGTTVGGMDKSEQYYIDFLNNDTRNDYIALHDAGACTEQIADICGRFAFVTTPSTACSSAANAIILAANIIKAGLADIVVAGGSECITKFHLNGFNTLMILDRQPCRPFCATRAGLNLGEGAAYVVLESEQSARRRGVQAHALLSGYGNSCDAFHQTASSPDGEGSFKAMSQAIAMAGLQASDIDYINAHGTGTPNNDASESAAMRRLFGDSVPMMSSVKSFTGHTTSASGSIELVICLLAMKHHFVPANLNWQQADEDVLVTPVTATRQGVTLNHILCNAFGFGGNDSSMLITSAALAPSTFQYLPDGQASQKLKSSKAQKLPSIFIKAANQVSIQQPLSEQWMTSPLSYTAPYVRSIDPAFRDYISAIEARRMGKLLKRALVTSLKTLHDSGISQPDAIITGTGLGCIENTEIFLDQLCREGEELLKPTIFMQSTHNTISSLLAIHTKTHGYNVTYSHRGMSFDSALFDAYVQLRSGTIGNALVGSHDEMTQSYFTLLQRIGYVGGDSQRMAAEASVATMLVNTPDDCLCRLSGTRLVYNADDTTLTSTLQAMLDESGMSINDIDAVLTSDCGPNDSHGQRLCSLLANGKPCLRYKNLFGECYSASAFAVYTAAHCIAQGFVPDCMRCKPDDTTPITPRHLLLINHDGGKNVSLTILSTTRDT